MSRIEKDLLEANCRIKILTEELLKINEQNDRFFQGFSAAIGVIHYYMRKYPKEKRADNWLDDYCRKPYGETRGERIE